MDIGLIDVDSHNFPNLCLMKLAAYHKAQGDRVEWYNHDRHYDIVYQSKVFDDTYTLASTFPVVRILQLLCWYSHHAATMRNMPFFRFFGCRRIHWSFGYGATMFPMMYGKSKARS